MPKDPTPVTFDELHVDDKQFYMVPSPAKRVVRVVGHKTIQVTECPDGVTKRLVDLPCVVVEATVPALEIKGFVTPKQAKQNLNILKGLIGSTEDDEYDHRIWRELWAVRTVFAIKVNREHGGVTEIDEDRPMRQLYCQLATDLNGQSIAGPGSEEMGATLRSSGIAFAKVVAYRLTPTQIKGDPFAVARAIGQEEEAAA